MGKKLTIVPEKPLAGSGWLRHMKMSDQLTAEESVYREKYRPQFHFSARRGCITDLDGPIYFKGEYHIFPGHRPWQLNGNAGSNPLWGHAVSKDLIHWEELGTAVTANKLGSPWSGSTIIDWYNTAGFVKNPIKGKDGRLKNPAMIAIYTNGHGGRSVPEPTQSLNYSLDFGRTWLEYPGNPVMPFVAVYNRDPKIVWYEAKANPDDSHWVVVLLLDGPNSSVWTSRDMIHWERSQTLDNIDVCPDCADFYEIALDGDQNNRKWILWFGDGNYNVGTFDGKNFKKESKPLGEIVEVNAVFTVKKDVMAQPVENIVGLDINGQTVTCNLDKEQMIGNDGLQTTVSFADGKLRMESLQNRAARADYLKGQAAVPLFTHQLDGAAIAADDGGWTLEGATTKAIELYGRQWGQRLEITLSRTKPVAFSTRQVFEIYHGRAALRYFSFVKNGTDKEVTINASDVFDVNPPDRPRKLHFVEGYTRWNSSPESLARGGRNCLVRYDDGHGLFVLLENNWATSLEPGGFKGLPNEKMLYVDAAHENWPGGAHGK